MTRYTIRTTSLHVCLIVVALVLSGCAPFDKAESDCIGSAKSHQERIECINAARKSK